MMNESSLSQLYDSAVEAFPHTRFRQHATGPVKIVGLRWTPFFGLRTLFVRGTAQNEGREYDTMILFKKVNYVNEERHAVRIMDTSGVPFNIERFKPEQDVLVRCSCPDFRWRFNYYDHLDHSLYGNKAAKYRATVGAPANPLKLPGVCKHIMKLQAALLDAGLFQ